MSIFSDHNVGALSDEEFEMACTSMNIEDRYDEEHMYDETEEEDDDEE